MTLTRRQYEVLDFIKDFHQRQGYMPTLEEIGAEFGLRSMATVHKHVSNLEAKGLIRRKWNHARSIEVVTSTGCSRCDVLSAALRPLLWCPCCEAEECREDCDYEENAPDAWRDMQAARAAMEER